MKSAARVAFGFSRENDACSKHVIVKVLIFKCKASCTGHMEGKALQLQGLLYREGL